MAAWRRKLIGSFPCEKDEWEHESSLYVAFYTLLDMLGRAVRDKDDARAMDIFSFAEWCYNQRATDLKNAAAVAFYEHLADDPEIAAATPRFLKRAIFDEVEPLIVQMRGEEAARSIRDKYR